jgi:hypothetical protein
MMKADSAGVESKRIGRPSELDGQCFNVTAGVPARAEDRVVLVAGRASPSCRRRARTLSTGRRRRGASSVAGMPASPARRRSVSSSSDHGRGGRRAGRRKARRRAVTASSERPTS